MLIAAPEARSHRLPASADRTATTFIWSCTEGKFNWYYDLDETAVILEGSILLESEDVPLVRYDVGDVIYFRKGAHAKWHVERYVKKVAFCRQTNPIGFGLASAPSTSSSGCSQSSLRRNCGGSARQSLPYRTIRILLRRFMKMKRPPTEAAFFCPV